MNSENPPSRLIILTDIPFVREWWYLYFTSIVLFVIVHVFALCICIKTEVSATSSTLLLTHRCHLTQKEPVLATFLTLLFIYWIFIKHSMWVKNHFCSSKFDMNNYFLMFRCIHCIFRERGGKIFHQIFDGLKYFTFVLINFVL